MTGIQAHSLQAEPPYAMFYPSIGATNTCMRIGARFEEVVSTLGLFDLVVVLPLPLQLHSIYPF